MKFSSPEQAVRFAYNMSAREIASKPNLTGQAGGSNEGLSPHELHAEGAMILTKVNTLPPGQRAAIVSLLAPIGSEDGNQACLDVVEYLWPQISAITPNKEAAVMVIAGWTHRLRQSRDTTVRAMAERLGLSYRKAREMRDAVVTKHGALYMQAIAALEPLLFGPNGLELK